jgi:hypothetical protein
MGSFVVMLSGSFALVSNAGQAEGIVVPLRRDRSSLAGKLWKCWVSLSVQNGVFANRLCTPGRLDTS